MPPRCFTFSQFGGGAKFVIREFRKDLAVHFFGGRLGLDAGGLLFKTTSFKAVTGVLYGFGVLAFWFKLARRLVAKPKCFLGINLSAIGFGVIFLSVYVKSKAFLVFGSFVFNRLHFKTNREYFESGLGWPASLGAGRAGNNGDGVLGGKVKQTVFC